MKLKTKILILAFLLLTPFYCGAIFNIDIPKIDTKKIMWDATCGLVQTKAQQKAANIKNKITRDTPKFESLDRKLRNTIDELKNRGYPTEKLEADVQRFLLRAEFGLGNIYQSIETLEQIKTDACRKDKVWATNKLEEARIKLQDGRRYYEELKYDSVEDFFDHLNELKNNRVRSNR